MDFNAGADFSGVMSGWLSLVSIILLVGGLQLMCLGIIGQYLAKTYLEAKRRPIYLVRETGVGRLGSRG